MAYSSLSHIYSQDSILKNNFNVAVFLATHNGLKWLSEQIDSIANQEMVNVTIFVSDDASQDGTYDYLNTRSEYDTQIKVLSQKPPFESAGRNFYRLIAEVNIKAFDYIAYSDQDDEWKSDKLIRHIKLAIQHAADGVSSNVLAFWPDGKQKLIVKSQPQKKWDFLFESAGPGCTFLMTPRLISLVREQLLKDDSPAKNVALHDWLCYAICRASGLKWIIDSTPSVLYRQHNNNLVGANVGLTAKFKRFINLQSSWYRNEVIKVAEACQKIKFSSNLAELLDLLKNKNFITQIKLLKFVSHSRRKITDRILLAAAIIIGIF